MEELKKKVKQALEEGKIHGFLGLKADEGDISPFFMTKDNIAELVKLIDGQVLNSTEKTDELAGSIMLGAMTVDSALPYFNRMANKVAVIRSERPDMQMAALQTSTRALVVTGASPMIPQVQNLAEDKKVPVRVGVM